VIELPAPQPIVVVEHQVVKRWCSWCGRWQAPHRDLRGQVSGQGRVGVRLASLIASLRTTARLPLRRIRAYLQTLHGVPLRVGELAELLHRVQQATQPALEGLKQAARAIAGPHVAPRDPVQVMERLTLNGVSYGPPPFRAVPPFVVASYPLGVDLIGRDVLSRLLWAVRPTLILCVIVVLVRVAVGTLFGLIAGWVGGATARVIEGLRSMCIAIPMLAFAIAGILWLRRVENVGAFVIALTLTGWCDTAALVKNHTQTVRHTPYIESARAIGLRPSAVLWRHVLPQFGPVLPVLVAFELTAVTLLVAELGYLGYFVGGGFVYEDPFVNVYVLTGAYPELGQMLLTTAGGCPLSRWRTLVSSCSRSATSAASSSPQLRCG